MGEKGFERIKNFVKNKKNHKNSHDFFISLSRTLFRSDLSLDFTQPTCKAQAASLSSLINLSILTLYFVSYLSRHFLSRMYSFCYNLKNIKNLFVKFAKSRRVICGRVTLSGGNLTSTWISPSIKDVKDWCIV
jgi:hypothetical protein